MSTTSADALPLSPSLGRGSFLPDARALTSRLLKHVTRSVDTIITATVMPVAMMLMIVYVFGGAISGGMKGGAYVDYMLPGILVITVASGIAYTALRLHQDMTGGMAERLRAMPISRSAFLWSHALTSLVANGLSLAIVTAVAFAMGFRPHASAAQWMCVVALLGLFTLACTWLAIIPGLLAKSPEGASAFSYPLIFLPFLSSAFVPTATMPAPLRWFAEHQPVTPLVNAVRDLFAGTGPTMEYWTAMAWCAVVLAVSWVGAEWIYRRRV